MLDRYQNLSSKVHVQYVDLLKDPTLARAENVTREGEAVVDHWSARREDAKTFDEEGVTGALIRALKGGERRSASSPATASIAWTILRRATGSPAFSPSLRKTTTKSRASICSEKAEVPADCTVLVVAGPTGDYIQPEVDAIKKYVEGGGRALFMLDPPLKLGREADRR